jgi:hypothetical protein
MIDYHIQMTARCDCCGRVIDKAVVLKPSAIDPKRWDWQREWKASGVMKRERRYGQPLIYCQPCADGAPNDQAHLQPPGGDVERKENQ